MKSAGLFLSAIFLVLGSTAQALTCAHVHSTTPAISPAVKGNSFVTDRGLIDYQRELEGSFRQELRALGPNDLWMDLGAGKGKAAIEFLKSQSAISRSPQVALIAYKLDRWFPFPSFQGKLQTRENALFEHMNLEDLGKAQLMTDVFGVLSYSTDLQSSLSKALSILDLNGSLFIRTVSFTTTFVLKDQRVINFEDFLKSIPGLEVHGEHGRLKIIKRSDTIEIPGLRLEKYNDQEMPPYRRFTVL